MEDKDELGRQLKEINQILSDPNFISQSTNEELMTYLFMVERIEDKITKMVNMENKGNK